MLILAGLNRCTRHTRSILLSHRRLMVLSDGHHGSQHDHQHDVLQRHQPSLRSDRSNRVHHRGRRFCQYGGSDVCEYGKCCESKYDYDSYGFYDHERSSFAGVSGGIGFAFIGGSVNDGYLRWSADGRCVWGDRDWSHGHVACQGTEKHPQIVGADLGRYPSEMAVGRDVGAELQDGRRA